jgi:hypothetical protein
MKQARNKQETRKNQAINKEKKKVLVVKHVQSYLFFLHWSWACFSALVNSWMTYPSESRVSAH